jgi:hypothetical protein
MCERIIGALTGCRLKTETRFREVIHSGIGAPIHRQRSSRDYTICQEYQRRKVMIVEDNELGKRRSNWPMLARREQARPELGTRLIVEDPEIKEVFDLESGELLRSEAVIGTDYGQLVQLRMQIRMRWRRGHPMYRCPICGVAVHICRSWKEPRFFFKHRHEDGSCSAVTAGELSQKEIDARRYNGVKESALHIAMKQSLVDCLSADPQFSNISVEQVWKGKWTTEWRKPDVQATFKGIRVAFEIQLSTTYLDVIAARRDFYLQQGGLLFWIFARFETDRLRMTEDDVFYNNNFNAFVVNPKTIDASLSASAFQLECIWSTPVPGGGVSGFRRQTVPFDQLTLDTQTQRAFYYDFERAKRECNAKADAENEILRNEFEEAFASGAFFNDGGQRVWAEMRARLASTGITMPHRRMDLPYTLIQALYSAKRGAPVASRKKHLVEIAHHIATGSRQHLQWFSLALRHWDRGPQLKREDRSGLWARKVQACRNDKAVDPTSFSPDRTYQRLIEFLFPELGSLG